jgi:uncharacterized membrane protein YeaQ/YmgE (transglycosylase-associated protein family)
MHSDTVFASIAIGAAAALAGMIWPFRRGAKGIAVNFAAGIGGALVAALASFAVLPKGRDGSARLLFAAFGALALLGLVHVWPARRHTRRPPPIKSP